MAGAITPAVFWSPETHATTILAEKVRRRRLTSGDMLLRAEGQKSTDLSLFKTTMAKPFKMLFTEPIIFLVATYIGVISGILCVSLYHPFILFIYFFCSLPKLTVPRYLYFGVCSILN